MIRVGILGATGYTALELMKILLRHPEVEITALTSRQAGNPHGSGKGRDRFRYARDCPEFHSLDRIGFFDAKQLLAAPTRIYRRSRESNGITRPIVFCSEWRHGIWTDLLFNRYSHRPISHRSPHQSRGHRS